jgi:hypothetical protein
MMAELAGKALAEEEAARAAADPEGADAGA